MKDKHVFITYSTDKFLYLHLDALIKKTALSSSSFVVVVVERTDGEFDKLVKYPGVLYLNSSAVNLDEFKEIKTLTSMSLYSYISCYISSILDLDDTLVEKYYLFLTDDEYDRWGDLFNKHGSLVPSTKHVFSEFDIKVLSRVKNIIGFESAFKDRMLEILGRSDIKFIDCGIVFDAMTVANMSCFDGFNNFEFDIPVSNVPRVLYRTKRFGSKSYPDWIDFIKCCFKYGRNIHIVTYMSSPYLIFKTELMRKIYGLFSSAQVTIDYNKHSNAFAYTMSLLSCDYIILQDRGGASSARTYLKYKNGPLLIKQDSHNAQFFECGYGIKVYKYKNASDLVGLLFSHNFESNNREIVKEAEVLSLNMLQEIYA